ncbi:MAG: thermonuclease family protein [Caldimonas sp.]
MAWPASAGAQGRAPVERLATVVHVTDGDTVWVEMGPADPLLAGRVKVRIDGIDAPESCQTGGPEARAALAQRLQGQSVHLLLRRQDAYARWLGRLHHEGEDVGAWMVAQGLAWSYRFASGRGPYDAEEAQAREARRGLFAHPDPMPPRVFRQWHGPCH